MSENNSVYQNGLDSVDGAEYFTPETSEIEADNRPSSDQDSLDGGDVHQSGIIPPNLETQEARKQLAEELDNLIERIKTVSPEYEPPVFSPQRLLSLIGENISRFSTSFSQGLLAQLKDGVGKDLLDMDTWKGVWFMLNYTLDYQKEIINRRISGEFPLDDWGYDQEVVDAVKPFFQFLYKYYWRVQVTGVENIPDEGRALLVSNHSGQLPFDGSMVGLAIHNEHPNQRLVRTLYASWFPTLPVLSPLLVKMGQTLANEENGVRLLEDEQLVAVYPEGYKGVGKLFKDRYRLARFGRGGFVRMALRTGSSMIPVAVVGAEETYISLFKVDFIARLIGFPYFPISPTFPWLGLLGFVPIPTKWFIDFGEPIQTVAYGPKAANNLMLVSQLTDQMRNIVQNMIYDRLSQRKSVLFG